MHLAYTGKIGLPGLESLFFYRTAVDEPDLRTKSCARAAPAAENPLACARGSDGLMLHTLPAF
jgi:hypothetical protein